MSEKPAERRGCVGIVAKLLVAVFGKPEAAGGGGKTLPEPRVMVSTKFITPAEQSFYGVLIRVVGDRGHILAQVAINQLLFFPGNRGTPGRLAWQNKVKQRSIDFLVCDRRTLRPLVAIELDDASHDAPDRQRRDAEVDRLFAAAGLPLVHVRAARAYDTRELAAEVEPHLTGDRDAS